MFTAAVEVDVEALVVEQESVDVVPVEVPDELEG
jgi:hypothetical protein